MLLREIAPFSRSPVPVTGQISRTIIRGSNINEEALPVSLSFFHHIVQWWADPKTLVLDFEVSS